MPRIWHLGYYLQFSFILGYKQTCKFWLCFGATLILQMVMQDNKKEQNMLNKQFQNIVTIVTSQKVYYYLMIVLLHKVSLNFSKLFDNVF